MCLSGANPGQVDDPIAMTATSAMTLWIVPQIAALCASAWRMPLTASFVEPAESAAAALMVSVQVITAAALFPVVVGDWRRLVQAAVTGWAFGGLAGFLATAAWVPLMLSVGHVTLWLAALWAWAGVARRGSGSGLAIAAAMLLTVGGVMLHYLQAEYQPGTLGGNEGGMWDFTPLITSVRQLQVDDVLWVGWAVTAAWGGIGLGARGLVLRGKRLTTSTGQNLS